MVMYANEFETREKQKLTTTFTNRLDDEWAGCDRGGGGGNPLYKPYRYVPP